MERKKNETMPIYYFAFLLQAVKKLFLDKNLFDDAKAKQKREQAKISRIEKYKFKSPRISHDQRTKEQS